MGFSTTVTDASDPKDAGEQSLLLSQLNNMGFCSPDCAVHHKGYVNRSRGKSSRKTAKAGYPFYRIG